MNQIAYLLADIGATNARFRSIDREGNELASAELATGDYATAEALVDDAAVKLGERFAAALFAVAGPVLDGGAIEVTNAMLHFEPDSCGERLGCHEQSGNPRSSRDDQRASGASRHLSAPHRTGRFGSRRLLLGPDSG